MRWCRWMVGLLVAWHIGVALCYNVQGAAHSMALMRHQLAGQSTAKALHLWSRLERTPFVALYSHFTGLATGYGFYAPRVASPFQLQVVYCRNTAPCDTVIQPSWARGAYALRYRAFTSSLRDLLPDAARHETTDSLSIRYTRLLVANSAQRLAAQHHATAVHWQVQAIGLPTLRGQIPPYRYLLSQDSIIHLQPTDHALAIP